MKQSSEFIKDSIVYLWCAVSAICKDYLENWWCTGEEAVWAVCNQSPVSKTHLQAVVATQNYKKLSNMRRTWIIHWLKLLHCLFIFLKASCISLKHFKPLKTEALLVMDEREGHLLQLFLAGSCFTVTWGCLCATSHTAWSRRIVCLECNLQKICTKFSEENGKRFMFRSQLY